MEGQLGFSPQHPSSEEPSVFGFSPSAGPAPQHMSKACRASINYDPSLSRGAPAEPLQDRSDLILKALCNHHHLQTSNPHFYGTGRAGIPIASYKISPTTILITQLSPHQVQEDFRCEQTHLGQIITWILFALPDSAHKTPHQGMLNLHLIGAALSQDIPGCSVHVSALKTTTLPASSVLQP